MVRTNKSRPSGQARRQLRGMTVAPEGREWRGNGRRSFYLPLKRPVNMRVDADVLARGQRGGRGYQTPVNTLLRWAIAARKEEALKWRCRSALSRRRRQRDFPLEECAG